jgi:hypothetical protein
MPLETVGVNERKLQATMPVVLPAGCDARPLPDLRQSRGVSTEHFVTRGSLREHASLLSQSPQRLMFSSSTPT